MRNVILIIMAIPVVLGLVVGGIFGIVAGVVWASIIGMIYGFLKKDRQIKWWSIVALVAAITCIVVFCLAMMNSNM